MDWTIVVSVLVALLLWPMVLGSVIALVGITAATVFRGRIQGLTEQKMARCKEMFNSWAPAGAAGPTESGACPCAGPSEGGN